MALREILLELDEDDFGGPVPTDGRFVAVATAVRVDGEEVTLPNVLSRPIVNGLFTSPVLLEVPEEPLEWLWNIQIRDDEDTTMLRRTVTIPPGVAPIPVGDLPQIDPTTLTVTTTPEPAWWAQLEMRPIIIRLTQAEYDALPLEQKMDPRILYLVPTT